jgi:hypothetical protein
MKTWIKIKKTSASKNLEAEVILCGSTLINTIKNHHVISFTQVHAYPNALTCVPAAVYLISKQCSKTHSHKLNSKSLSARRTSLCQYCLCYYFLSQHFYFHHNNNIIYPSGIVNILKNIFSGKSWRSMKMLLKFFIPTKK